MPRPADPTARERILTVASKMFYERGVQQVGLSEIVDVAGTGKNVLYRHFPGKDELVLAYLQQFAECLDKDLDVAYAGLPPDEALLALSEHVAGIASDRRHRGCPFRNYLRETRDSSSRPGRFALTQVRALRERVIELSAELDVDDPGRVADEVWLVLEGVYAAASYPEGRRVVTTSVNAVRTIIDRS